MTGQDDLVAGFGSPHQIGQLLLGLGDGDVLCALILEL
jgi:hypothetical protein